MRSEREMLDLILDTAQRDERVRAVIMNGSKVNPNAPKDFFQDYDVVYIVTEKESFLADPGWIKVFGELMILQLPDEMSDPASRSDRSLCLSDAVRRWQPHRPEPLPGEQAGSTRGRQPDPDPAG